MAGNAFTAGVKPGGLTTSTEIRILLCYLIQHAGTPLSQGELETALLGEELVNYFELASNLSDLLEQGFVREENGRYTILPAGADIAEALADDVPRSVRDAAVRATLAAQQFARKEAQHHAQITPAASGTGYNVQCSIRDMESDVFSFSLYVPDKLTAKLARAQFIENGRSFCPVYPDTLPQFLTDDVRHSQQGHLCFEASLKQVLDSFRIEFRVSSHKRVECRVDGEHQLVQLRISLHGFMALAFQTAFTRIP